MGAPQPTLGQYGGRGQAVEVEGAGRSKAQLIVGIDFVCRPDIHLATVCTDIDRVLLFLE